MDCDEHGGVMITSYSNFVKQSGNVFHRDQFVDPGADLLVLDEGHTIKNNETIITETVAAVATRLRIILTGTPMQNNLKECKYHERKNE